MKCALQIRKYNSLQIIPKIPSIDTKSYNTHSSISTSVKHEWKFPSLSQYIIEQWMYKAKDRKSIDAVFFYTCTPMMQLNV